MNLVFFHGLWMSIEIAVWLRVIEMFGWKWANSGPGDMCQSFMKGELLKGGQVRIKQNPKHCENTNGVELEKEI